MIPSLLPCIISASERREVICIVNAPNSHTDVTRLEHSLRSAEEALEQRYRDLGRSVLETAEAESAEINHLLDEVIELKRRLSCARADIECPACLNLNAPGSRYCSHCGTALPEFNALQQKG